MGFVKVKVNLYLEPSYDILFWPICRMDSYLPEARYLPGTVA